MFTGIIKTTGIVKEYKNGFLAIQVNSKITRGVAKGGSVSVDGVCLTALKRNAALHVPLKRGIKPRATSGVSTLAFELMDSTLKRTTLGQLKIGAIVNIEPALLAGEPLGGHFVSGHVDDVGIVSSVVQQGNTRHMAIRVPQKLSKYIIPQGSVTINGVSLTIVDKKADIFSVALTQYTLKHTNLIKLQKGDKVNIEVDLLAKYLKQ